jgi:hypothetical protein
MWLLAGEYFIEFSYCESFKLCITNKSYDKQCIPVVDTLLCLGWGVGEVGNFSNVLRMCENL